MDAKLKENRVGAAHEVTDRIFVVRRAYRVNDSLPAEDAKSHWRWELGGGFKWIGSADGCQP